MRILFDCIALLLGLAFGSFTNVLIYRRTFSLKKLSAPSACLSCRNKILRRDNLPIVSWLLLRGKCRSCGSSISPIYPIVELSVGLLFLAFATLTDPFLPDATPSAMGQRLLVLLALWWLACAGIALVVIDFKEFILPNAIVYPTFVVAVLAFGASSIIGGDFEPLARSTIGVAASAGIFTLILLVAPQGMGVGDLKLAGVLGFYLGWFGWGALFIGLLTPFLFGSVFGISQIWSKRAILKSRIAFGPWMVFGALFAIFFGNQIWDGYVEFLQQAIN